MNEEGIGCEDTKRLKRQEEFKVVRKVKGK